MEAPEYMQGSPFLGAGSETTKRIYAFGHRDRIDEAVDCSRSVRSQRFLYIRNFMPHLSWNQYSAYSDMSEIRHELYEVAERGDGSQAQMHYVGASKPVEELYDCHADPGNTNNLAQRPDYQKKLRQLRKALEKHVADERDLGFLSEVDAWQYFGGSTPWEAARKPGFVNHVRAAHAAWSAHGASDSDRHRVLDAESNDVRYWQVLGRCAHSTLDTTTRDKLVALLADSSAMVRIQAAYALAKAGQGELAIPALIRELEQEDLTITLYAARAIELLGAAGRPAALQMKQLSEHAAKLTAADTPAVFSQSGAKDLAMFCGFSANGFLTRLRQGPWRQLLDVRQQQAWDNVDEAVQFADQANEVAMLSKGKNLWIVHQREYEDFELTAEVRMPKEEYNAGIGFRCQLLPNGRPRGYQCEVAEQKTGMLYAIGSGGWVWPRSEKQQQQFAEMVGDAFRSDKWNDIRIRCDGPKIQIWVNGILTTDIRDDRHSTGRIALQHHGKGGVHRYRNVKIRELQQLELAQ